MAYQLNKPTNQTAEVLYALLTRRRIDRRQMLLETGILNVTARIANLRKLGIDIRCYNRSVRNKHGRTVTFGAWAIHDSIADQAAELYPIVNKERK